MPVLNKLLFHNKQWKRFNQTVLYYRGGKKRERKQKNSQKSKREMLSPKSLGDNVSLHHFSVKDCEAVNSNRLFTVCCPLFLKPRCAFAYPHLGYWLISPTIYSAVMSCSQQWSSLVISVCYSFAPEISAALQEYPQSPHSILALKRCTSRLPPLSVMGIPQAWEQLETVTTDIVSFSQHRQ